MGDELFESKTATILQQIFIPYVLVEMHEGLPIREGIKESRFNHDFLVGGILFWTASCIFVAHFSLYALVRDRAHGTLFLLNKR